MAVHSKGPWEPLRPQEQGHLGTLIAAQAADMRQSVFTPASPKELDDCANTQPAAKRRQSASASPATAVNATTLSPFQELVQYGFRQLFSKTDQEKFKLKVSSIPLKPPWLTQRVQSLPGRDGLWSPVDDAERQSLLEDLRAAAIQGGVHTPDSKTTVLQARLAGKDLRVRSSCAMLAAYWPLTCRRQMEPSFSWA